MTTKLEAEFQIRQQRSQAQRSSQLSYFSTPSPVAAFASDAPPAASMWVKLLNPPASICSDEALLLCQGRGDRWVAWIPDYGKILLSPRDFFVAES